MSERNRLPLKVLSSLSDEELNQYGVNSGIYHHMHNKDLAMCGHFMLHGICRTRTVKECMKDNFSEREIAVRQFAGEVRSRLKVKESVPVHSGTHFEVGCPGCE